MAHSLRLRRAQSCWGATVAKPSQAVAAGDLRGVDSGIYESSGLVVPWLMIGGCTTRYPICSMYVIFTYIWAIFGVNAIHGAYGYDWNTWLNKQSEDWQGMKEAFEHWIDWTCVVSILKKCRVYWDILSIVIWCDLLTDVHSTHDYSKSYMLHVWNIYPVL